MLMLGRVAYLGRFVIASLLTILKKNHSSLFLRVQLFMILKKDHPTFFLTFSLKNNTPQSFPTYPFNHEQKKNHPNKFFPLSLLFLSHPITVLKKRNFIN